MTGVRAPAVGGERHSGSYAERVRRVRDTTAAPEPWDGARWTAELTWSAAVIGAGGGVIVDLDGAAVRETACFDR